MNARSSAGPLLMVGAFILVLAGAGYMTPAALLFLAVFAGAALPTGAAVACCLHALPFRRQTSMLSIVNQPAPERHPRQVPYIKGQDVADLFKLGGGSRLLVLFTLRYHPVFGNYPDKRSRKRLYTEFWHSVSHRREGFALYIQLKDSDLVSSEGEISQDFIDLISMALSAPDRRSGAKAKADKSSARGRR